MVGTLGAVRLVAQNTPPPPNSLAFEVASIKPNHSLARRASIGWQNHRWLMVNVSAKGLVVSAYPTLLEEIIGEPAWLGSERFDVDARAGFTPTPDQETLLLRALLAERFAFAGHYETVDRPVYNLVLDRADGRLGPQLKGIDIDCAIYRAPSAAGATGDVPPCRLSMQAGNKVTMRSTGRTMASLAENLAGLVSRPVVDQSGLAGYYDFTLEFDDYGVGGLSVFTALREQLGLKLESARAQLQILKIDHIERPTPD